MPERMSMSNEEQTVENKQPHGASEPWAKAAEYGGPQSCQGPSLQGTGVLHLVDLITPFVWFFLATHHNPVFSAAARTLLLPMLLYFLPLASRHLVLNSPFAYTPSVCACSVTTVVSNSVRPHGLQPTRLPCPWGSQARTLEWVATHASRGSAWPQDQTQVCYISCTGRQVLYHQQHHLHLQPSSRMFSEPCFFN